jgi:hypothetical protein
MNTYKLPQDVISPKTAISHIRVLEDKEKDSYSIAKLKFHNVWSIACRWNGSKKDPAGHPNSRGIPTWFIIPKEIKEDIISGVIRRAQKEKPYIYEELKLIHRWFDLQENNEDGTSISILPLRKITSRTDANVLVEMIKEDELLQSKHINVFEMDNEGNDNQDPISQIGNQLHITLYYTK